jgi:hypothetical protein
MQAGALHHFNTSTMPDLLNTSYTPCHRLVLNPGSQVLSSRHTHTHTHISTSCLRWLRRFSGWCHTTAARRQGVATTRCATTWPPGVSLWWAAIAALQAAAWAMCGCSTCKACGGGSPMTRQPWQVRQSRFSSSSSSSHTLSAGVAARLPCRAGAAPLNLSVVVHAPIARCQGVCKTLLVPC